MLPRDQNARAQTARAVMYRTLLSAIAAGVYRDAKDFIADFRRGFRMTRCRLGYRL